MGFELISPRSRFLSIASWVAILLLADNAFATPAGSVIFAKGPVTAEREPSVALTKGDEVLVADTVATGAAGRAQLLMLDGAKIAIRPNSRLRIEEFSFTESTGANGGAVVATSGDKSVTSLIKGGFRTITGAIGKADETAYEVRTPVGVLGVRGTDYMAVFCRADCTWAPGVSASDPLEDGLYLGVTDGTIFFRNELGQFDLSEGEYAFIPMVDRTLRRLAEPPGVFRDDIQLIMDENDAAGVPVAGAGSQLRFDGKLGIRREPDKPAIEEDSTSKSPEEAQYTPAQPILGIDADGNLIDLTPGKLPPDGDRTISFSVGSLGAQGTQFAGVQDNLAGEYQVDLSNNLTEFTAPYPSPGVNETGQYDIGTSSLAESGFDSMTMLRWGRWTGGTVNIILSSGVDASQDLGNQSLHWISGPENGVPVMPITGSAIYSLVGATSPTDNFGNTGVLGDATFTADFMRQLVTSDLSITMGPSIWNASGTGTLGAGGLPAHLFSGDYLNVTVDGVAGGTGFFSGFFSEPGPSPNPAVPGGVGLTYSLRDEPGVTTVTGAAAFGDPVPSGNPQ